MAWFAWPLTNQNPGPYAWEFPDLATGTLSTSPVERVDASSLRLQNPQQLETIVEILFRDHPLWRAVERASGGTVPFDYSNTSPYTATLRLPSRTAIVEWPGPVVGVRLLSNLTNLIVAEVVI